MALKKSEKGKGKTRKFDYVEIDSEKGRMKWEEQATRNMTME